MGVTVEIEVGEIGNRVGRSVMRHLAGPDEASEALSHFNVCKVGRMDLVPVSKEAGLDPGAKRSLQQKFEESRGVDDDHADSRSSRMTTAAGVFNVTRLRPWIRVSISSRVGRAARRSSSARRKSESVCPESAARLLSFRCSASGTLRIWTILDM